MTNQETVPMTGKAKGGYARASALSPEERTMIAKKAAETRWGVKANVEVQQVSVPTSELLPRAEYAGKLEIGDLTLPCAVLSDGRRVLSETGFTKVLGSNRSGAQRQKKQALPEGTPRLPVYISATNLKDFVPASLAIVLSDPIVYIAKSGRRANGIEAGLIPEVCEVWLKARQANMLLPSQAHIAASAEVLVRGLAHIGIIALVDEATGYQEVRNRNELHRILEAYITRELLPWTKRFPSEFYQELFRLRGWEYSPPSLKRPKLVGKLTNQLVYEKLPPGVLEELRRKNPVVKNGWRKHKHHQFLTNDIGNPHLERHIAAVTTLMRAAPSWNMFSRLFNRAFPSEGMQHEMDLGMEEAEQHF